MSGRFARFMAIDWSGAMGPLQPGIAVAVAAAGEGVPRLLEPGAEAGGAADRGAPDDPSPTARIAPGRSADAMPSRPRRWSRAAVLDLLLHRLPADTLVGLDLGIALPFADCAAYFPGLARSPPDAPALWAMVEQVCAAEPHLAATAFADHPDLAPFFRRHGGREGARFRCDAAAHGRGRFRVTEARQAAMGCRPYSNFNLVGAAQVGKSSLTGMRLLHRLRGRLPVWPIDPLPARGSVIVEIYTTIAAIAAGRSPGRAKIRSGEELDAALAALDSPPTGLEGAIDDHRTDALLSAAWLRANADRPELWHPPGLSEVARTEGWTFGAV